MLLETQQILMYYGWTVTVILLDVPEVNTMLAKPLNVMKPVEV